MGFFKDFFKTKLLPHCKDGKHKQIGALMRGGLVCLDCLSEFILYIDDGRIKIVEKTPEDNRSVRIKVS